MNNHVTRNYTQLLADSRLRETTDAESYRRWSQAQSGHAFALYESKRIVTYHLNTGDKKPQVIQTLRCTEITATGSEGLVAEFLVQEGALTRTVKVGYTPVELVEGCFIWIPAQNNTQWTEYYRGCFNLRIGVCLTSSHHPSIIVDNANYIVEESHYFTRFGDV